MHCLAIMSHFLWIACHSLVLTQCFDFHMGCSLISSWLFIKIKLRPRFGHKSHNLGVNSFQKFHQVIFTLIKLNENCFSWSYNTDCSTIVYNRDHFMLNFLLWYMSTCVHNYIYNIHLHYIFTSKIGLGRGHHILKGCYF